MVKMVFRRDSKGRNRTFVSLKKDRQNNDIKNDLLRMLHSQLPDHFIPKDIVILDKMPITQNGKIDYRELTRKYNLI